MADVTVDKDLYDALLAMFAAEVDHTAVKDSLWTKEKVMRMAMQDVKRLLPSASSGS